MTARPRAVVRWSLGLALTVGLTSCGLAVCPDATLLALPDDVYVPLGPLQARERTELANPLDGATDIEVELERATGRVVLRFERDGHSHKVVFSFKKTATRG